MKRIVLLLIAVTGAISVCGQIPNIYAVVNGNEVTLWQTAAQRNCCALYQMEVDQDDFTITWLQKDTGDVCYCICHFDLSVTFGPLSVGDYTANVYCTEAVSQDTLFQGSTSFVIESAGDKDPVTIIDTYQSDCYNYVSVSEPAIDNYGLNVFPNPVLNNELTIRYRSLHGDNAGIYIYNVTGQLLKSFDNLSPGAQIIKWDLTNESGSRLSPGIYFVIFRTSKETSYSRLVVSSAP